MSDFNFTRRKTGDGGVNFDGGSDISLVFPDWEKEKENVVLRDC